MTRRPRKSVSSLPTDRATCGWFGSVMRAAYLKALAEGGVVTTDYRFYHCPH